MLQLRLGTRQVIARLGSTVACTTYWHQEACSCCRGTFSRHGNINPRDAHALGLPKVSCDGYSSKLTQAELMCNLPFGGRGRCCRQLPPPSVWLSLKPAGRDKMDLDCNLGGEAVP